MVDAQEEELLRQAAANRPNIRLKVTVTGCAYSCCGRGWQRRDGYEQVYEGWVDNFKPPEGEAQGTFMIYSPGIGKLSYVVAIRFSEVELIENGR